VLGRVDSWTNVSRELRGLPRVIEVAMGQAAHDRAVADAGAAAFCARQLVRRLNREMV
jgi:hypothetical protein